MSGENNMHTLLPECFQDTEFVETNFTDSGPASPDNIFSILEALEGNSSEFNPLTPLDHETSFAQKEGEPVEAATRILVSQKSTSSLSAPLEESETEPEAADDSPKSAKRQKLITARGDAENGQQQKISHITVERNRRKQMNDNLSVLRSLMPSFYVKRSDQASIVGGVVDYISELQQVLQSLEAKKQRKAYTEVLSPRLNSVSSPRTLPLSPRKPPLSPRVPPSLPISPRTPQPTNPYKSHQPAGYLPPIMVSSSHELTPPSSTSIPIGNSANNDLVANSKSSIADVEVKFCGPNVLVKTISSRIPGQATKIISTLEDISLEVLNVSLGTIDDTMINSFTIKIGIECRLSAEELAHQIQQTFC